MTARLWGGSLGGAALLHLGAAVAALTWMQTPKSEMPAGAFAVEIASFGGTIGQAGGRAAAAPAQQQPEAVPKPQPQPEAAKPSPPQPVEPEVVLPKPKPKPPPKPEVKPKPAPKPAAKPASKPQPAASSPRPPEEAAAPASPRPPQAASVGGAGAPGIAAAEGSAGSPIVGRLGAGGVDAGTPLGRYKALVYHALWKHRRYPAVAQRMGYQGDVEVGFTVAADGAIRDVRLVRGSGFGALDREASEALFERVRRFPPFPAGLAPRDLSFRLVIPFRLS